MARSPIKWLLLLLLLLLYLGSDIVVVRDSPNMVYMLRDLSTLLTAMGNLAEHYTGQYFLSTLNDGQAVLERYVPQHTLHYCRTDNFSG